jgi:mRNA interferase MazF
MAGGVARGDIRMHHFAAPDKRRPVLVLSRNDAIAVLTTVMVAPITSTIHGVPSEVRLGVEHGLKGPCAVNLDHVQTVRQADLGRHVASLAPAVMHRVCQALAIAAGCD